MRDALVAQEFILSRIGHPADSSYREPSGKIRCRDCRREDVRRFRGTLAALTVALAIGGVAAPATASTPSPGRAFTAMVRTGDPYTTAAWPAVGMDPRNAIEACISTREHGGGYSAGSNPYQFGRWQVSKGLWASYASHLETWFPGITGRWGTAGPVEQDAVFLLIVANDGYSPWTPYDGC